MWLPVELLRRVFAPTTVSLLLSLPFSFHLRDEVDRKRTAGSCGICKESLRKEVTVQMSGSEAATMPKGAPAALSPHL